MKKRKGVFQINGVPDPTEDFDGFVNAIIQQEVDELAKVPEEDRPLYWLSKAAEHLQKIIHLKAPDLLIRMALDRMERRISEVRETYPPAESFLDDPEREATTDIP